MKNAIVFNVKELKQYVYAVIKSSYEMGIAYVEKRPSFSKEEAIKRFQDAHWEDIKELWDLIEVEEQ